MANIDNSSPSNGKKNKNVELIPIKGKIPRPHAAQPGTRIPKKAPIEPNTPVFFDFFGFTLFTTLILNAIKLNNAPNKTLINVKDMKECNIKVLWKPIERVRKNLKNPKKPSVE